MTNTARIAVLAVVAAGAIACQGDTLPSPPARVRSDMRHVIYAQQAFLSSHSHFAHSLAELDSSAVIAVGVRFDLLEPADSSFRLVGTSTFGRTVRCELRVTAADQGVPTIPCASAGNQ